MKREAIVKEIKEIVRQFPKGTITILYGSEARGDASDDSDIDLLILLDAEKLTYSLEEKITMPLYLLEIRTGISISPKVYLKKQWYNRPFKTPFYINVMNEGIQL